MGGNGVAGVAAASTAGNAAPSATVIVAACVVVTAILVPFVTAWVYRRVGGRVREPGVR